MTGLTQKAMAEMLEAAWTYAQQVGRETGTAVELRLTVLGLTAYTTDRRCSRVATVPWSELARGDDLARAFSRTIWAVATPPEGGAAPVADLQSLIAA
ncbi:hypothetical protein [Methylobacterium sp. A54F]